MPKREGLNFKMFNSERIMIENKVRRYVIYKLLVYKALLLNVSDVQQVK